MAWAKYKGAYGNNQCSPCKLPASKENWILPLLQRRVYHQTHVWLLSVPVKYSRTAPTRSFVGVYGGASYVQSRFVLNAQAKSYSIDIPQIIMPSTACHNIITLASLQSELDRIVCTSTIPCYFWLLYEVVRWVVNMAITIHFLHIICHANFPLLCSVSHGWVMKFIAHKFVRSPPSD